MRAAGVFHLITFVLACFTPIPAGWDENLAKLPAVQRRFAVAQNFAVGATIAFLGVVCLLCTECAIYAGAFGWPATR